MGRQQLQPAPPGLSSDLFDFFCPHAADSRLKVRTEGAQGEFGLREWFLQGISYDDNAARREPRPAPGPANAYALSLFDNLNQEGLSVRFEEPSTMT